VSVAISLHRFHGVTLKRLLVVVIEEPRWRLWHPRVDCLALGAIIATLLVRGLLLLLLLLLLLILLLLLLFELGLGLVVAHFAEPVRKTELWGPTSRVTTEQLARSTSRWSLRRTRSENRTWEIRLGLGSSTGLGLYLLHEVKQELGVPGSIRLGAAAWRSKRGRGLMSARSAARIKGRL